MDDAKKQITKQITNAITRKLIVKRFIAKALTKSLVSQHEGKSAGFTEKLKSIMSSGNHKRSYESSLK